MKSAISSMISSFTVCLVGTKSSIVTALSTSDSVSSRPAIRRAASRFGASTEAVKGAVLGSFNNSNTVCTDSVLRSLRLRGLWSKRISADSGTPASPRTRAAMQMRLAWRPISPSSAAGLGIKRFRSMPPITMRRDGGAGARWPKLFREAKIVSKAGSKVRLKTSATTMPPEAIMPSSEIPR